MASRFTRNPNWVAEVRRSPEVRRVRREAAAEVAQEAERIGQQVAPSYACHIEDGPDKTAVEANTEGINAAAWIELGTGAPTPTPAYAPLRKGAEHAGLKTTGGKKR